MVDALGVTRMVSRIFMPQSYEVAHFVYGCVDHPVVMNDLTWPGNAEGQSWLFLFFFSCNFASF